MSAQVIRFETVEEMRLREEAEGAPPRPKDCGVGNHRGSAVFKEYDSGQRRFFKECNACGHMSGQLKKSDPVIKDAIPYRGIRDQQWKEWGAEYDAWRRDKKNREYRAWLAEHDAYLRTETWKRKRQQVIAREGGTCQGCRVARGENVHHLNYDRWKNELLTDLVLYCRACHEHSHNKRGR